MSVAFCTTCGRQVHLRSQFEQECPECGEETLVEEDPYQETALSLRCANCGYEVDGAPTGVDLSEEAGRYTVDDDCPVCQAGDLVPLDKAPPIRAMPEFAVARAAARALRQRHGDNTLPVDVERLALAEGLTIEQAQPGADGLLVAGTIRATDESEATRRYTIAHELGHHELRHKVPESKLEQEANAFAAELLIPTDALRSAVSEGATVSQLCRRFNVNRQPMVYALQHARLLNKVRT
jgi:predicted RNA-binding Zn-ribbon protein involved in translation (DUF1610 family)